MINSQVDYWVTGSSGHIGTCLIAELTTMGHSVLGIDYASPSSSSSQNFSFVNLNLGKTRDMEKILPTLPMPLKGFVHLAALTGSAALDGWGGPLESQSLESWEQAFAVNVSSAFLISREIARRISGANTPRDEAFSIVLTSSIYGSLGPNPSLYISAEMRNPAAYGSSKAALESIARYLSATSAGRMRVNSVAAGGIQRGQDASFVSEYSSRTPVGRMATEDDILQVIKFLLGDESRYVFGQTLLADGGFSIW